MPNRIIKESICVSEQIDELKPFEEVFFYRLLVNCDDYGCMDAREKILLSSLFPLKNLHLSDITKALRKLSEVGLIRLYTVDGKLYLKVIKWGEHQRLRVSKHKYPEPENDAAASCGNSRQVAASCGELQKTAADCGLTRAREESESEIEIESEIESESDTRRRGDSTQEDSFNVFWTGYPKKVAKQDALKAWNKLKPDSDLVNQIMSGLAAWRSSAEWAKNDGQFVPHPATWLNGRRWEDEVPKPAERKQTAPALPSQDYHQRDYSDAQENAFERMMALGGEDL
jgi:hypothetical protein